MLPGNSLRSMTALLGVVGVLALATALVGCGSTGSSAGVSSACQEVSAVLSDGPDPTADPVGYAEAQILPLRQIKTSDSSLHKAIAELADAYQTFFHDDGGKAAQHGVNRASRAVNAICPGAAS